MLKRRRGRRGSSREKGRCAGFFQENTGFFVTRRLLSVCFTVPKLTKPTSSTVVINSNREHLSKRQSLKTAAVLWDRFNDKCTVLQSAYKNKELD